MTNPPLANALRTVLRNCAIGACLVLGAASAAAQAAPAAAPAAAELTGQAASAQAWANELAAEATRTIERWLTADGLKEDRLFDRWYFPIQGTSPPKFTSSYDTLADRDFPQIQDKVLAKSTALVFAIITDVNGYVPSHNAAYAKPLTGNVAVDATQRTKRLLTDLASFRSGRNQAPYLFQQYRLWGEQVAEVSVPIRVHGRHFGCARVVYRLEK